MGTIRLSKHARERMRERGISEREVQEVLANAQVTTPGLRPNRVNRWGVTMAGRRLRITQPADDPSYVITVVAPEEDTR
ncbi:MAG: DUF4258 domain-containing protein [Actinomycetota bacterium]